MSTGKIGSINSESCQVKSSFEVNPAASSWLDLRWPEGLLEISETLHQVFLTCLPGGMDMSKCLAIKLTDRKTLRFIILFKALVEALTYFWQLWACDSREITVTCWGKIAGLFPELGITSSRTTAEQRHLGRPFLTPRIQMMPLERMT